MALRKSVILIGRHPDDSPLLPTPVVLLPGLRIAPIQHMILPEVFLEHDFLLLILRVQLSGLPRRKVTLLLLLVGGVMDGSIIRSIDTFFDI